jgi:hypothetical protein
MNQQAMMSRFAKYGLFLMLGTSLSACSDSWKEEVLLHNGNKIIVDRSQMRGGLREIGQSAPIKEYRISFTLPNTSRVVEWKAEYSEIAWRADPHPLALHVLNGVAYIIAEPVGCASYNKWGRPNPPYVIFKNDVKDWKRITIEELPSEFKNINLVNDTKSDADKLTAASLVTAEAVKNFNRDLKSAEYTSIIRDPIKPHTRSSNVNCEEQVLYKGYWILPNDPVARTIIDRRTKSN